MVVRLFLMTYPGGDNCILVIANSFIHMLMYTHYLCSVLKMKCWWRSYLTKLQLVQFLIIMYVNVVDLIKYNCFDGLIFRGNCQDPHWMNVLMILYMITMIVLFSRFYINRYMYELNNILTRRNAPKPKSA